MRKLIGLILIPLLFATPVLAASLGISPSHTVLEVPGSSSAVANFQVYYFTGDVQISLVDIPLKVEPDTIHVDAASNPVDIQLTIYGDNSLGSQVYDGYVRFLGSTGGSVAVAVKVKAKITNVVEGQPIPKEAIVPEQSSPPESTEEQSSEQPATDRQGGIAGLSSTMAIIIAGGLVFVGLILLSIVLLRRRRD